MTFMNSRSLQQPLITRSYFGNPSRKLRGVKIRTLQCLCPELSNSAGWSGSLYGDTMNVAIILVPIALFASLSRRGLGTRNEGLSGHRISRTSGLHVCSRDVSKDSVEQSWRFLLPLKISLFQIANQKNSN